MRFVARPVIVEAHRFEGNTVGMPEDFSRAVLRHLPNSAVEVLTGDGPRPCAYRDWIVRGPSGQFSVMRHAAFETFFEEHGASPDVSTKRAYNRKEYANG